MINICYDYGVKSGICFNPKKTKWMCTNVYSTIKNVSFTLNGMTIVNDNSIAYLEVKLVMKTNILTIGVDDRIKKFNISAYNVLINTKDLSDVFIVKLLLKSVCLYCYMVLEELMCLTIIIMRYKFHIEKFLYIFFIYH